MALRTVGVRLTADISQYTSALARAGAATKDFQGKLDQAAQGGHLDKVADAAGIAGIGLAGLAAGVVKMRMDFDKSMSAVQAATHAGASDIDKLRQAALQAGKDTQYSATQAANGITELAKAGVSTADILGGGLKGALSLAAAGQLDVGEAAETAATAMTQFGLSGKDIPHVADLLAAGAGKAQGSVHDMGYALKQGGLVASQFGLSVEDTVGTLSAFASAGMIGSDAGTSFKTMLLSLANPQEKTKEAMDELGISAYNAQGKFVGITNLAQQLHDKLGNLTQAQRDQTLAMIFGTDAIRAANVLYKEGGTGIQDWINKVNVAGYASQTAGDLTNNLSGDVERLKGSIETLAISSGSGANSGLRILTKSLDAMVGRFLAMPPAVSGTLTVLAGVGGASLLALAAFVKLRKGLAEAVLQLEATGPAGEKAAVGLQKTAGAAGKATVAFVALEGSAMILNAFGRKAADVDRLTASLTNLANTGQVTGEAADKFGKNLDGIGDDAAVATSGVAKWLDKISGGIPIIGDAAHAAVALGARLAGKDDYATATQNFENLDTALTQYMQTTGDARKASDLWNQVLLKSGKDTDQLAKLLPNAYKEVGALNTAADEASRSGKAMAGSTKAAAAGANALAGAAGPAADETKKLTTVSAASAAAARGQRDALKSLSDFMKQETDPVFALIKAEDDLTAAQKNYTKAVKDHGKGSTEAKQADRELALAAIALQGAVGDVSSNFNGRLTPALEKTLKAAGLSRAEIHLLELQFKDAKKAADQYNGNYRADVSVSGYKDAIGKLNRLSVYQQALKNGKIPPGFNGPIKGPDGNFYADGGQVGGWSPHSRADNIPAWLTAGEWVQPVASVAHYGPQVMAAIQHRKVPREVLQGFATGQLGKMGDLPLGLADGGGVWPFPVTAARTRIPSQAEVEAKVGGPAVAFLRAQNGKPYIWASAGPDGYDCSGIVSAVYNLLHGRNPYSHTFSTASLPGSWFPKAGIGGPLTAAWSNPGEAPASSTTGHMMGMVAGLTFESTGSRGVHLGASTRRLTDFAHIAHYAQGGPVGPHYAMANGGTITEPVFGVGVSGATYSLGEDYVPERVSPMWQTSGGAGPSVVNIGDINVTAPVGSHPREIGNAVLTAIGSALEGGSELRVNGKKIF